MTPRAPPGSHSCRVGVDVMLTTSPSTASSQTRLTVTAAVWLATQGAETGAGGTEQGGGDDAAGDDPGHVGGSGEGNVLGGQPGDGDRQVHGARDDGEHGAEPGVHEDLGRQEPPAAWCDEQGAGDRLVAELTGGAEDAEQQRGAGRRSRTGRGRAG